MVNKVAVIILNYNSSDDCRKCVSFLKRQEGVELELVLVDNCSPDGDKVEALCREQGCTFIASPENRGYNAGNNHGLRYAAKKGYKYALIANPDMEFPQTDYVKRLVEAMEQDEEIVVAGSDIVGIDNIHQNPIIRDKNWTTSFNWIINSFRKKSTDTYEFIDNYKENHYCTKVSGCCLMVRINFMRQIGYFDENVFLYVEEAILSRQVEKHHKKMYYVASAKAIHAHVKSTKGDPILRFKIWKKSRIHFVRHYSGDTWLGQQIQILGINLYICVYTLKKKINISRTKANER